MMVLTVIKVKRVTSNLPIPKVTMLSDLKSRTTALRVLST